ncbi:MAG: SUMF1/EgtB/PvdO family nonheme iron enzyme [Verrucomicrobiota bacterium]
MKTIQHLLLLSLLVAASALGQERSLGITNKMDLKPGQSWLHPRTGKRMVFVPSGFISLRPGLKAVSEFGGSGGIKGRKNGKEVQFSKFLAIPAQPAYVTGFLMDETEVTVADYLRFIRASGAPLPKDWNGKEPQEREQTNAVKISYSEVLAYTKWAGLRVPSIYEFCAGMADKNGHFPWSDDAKDIENGSAKDVSPVGIRDLLHGAFEWGLEENMEHWRLGFWLMPLSGTEKPKDVEVVANAFEPDFPLGFRCVDDSVSLPDLATTQNTSTTLTRKVPDTFLCSVTITNALADDTEVLLSDGHRFSMRAKSSQSVELPIGSYLVTYRVGASEAQASRVIHALLHPGPKFLGAREYRWTLTSTAGEAQTKMDRVTAADKTLAGSTRTQQPSTDVVARKSDWDAKPANWPKYSEELHGRMEVRVRNPNDFKVRVGLRSAGKGKDFTVSANGTESVRVPNGRYDIYFQYASDPDGLYEGDSFALSNNGVEIQIVKVVNGNYGIRKVR